MLIDHFKKRWPVYILLATTLFILRDPILRGKSFNIVNIGDFPPWSMLGNGNNTASNHAAHDQIFAYYPRKYLYRQAIRSGRLMRVFPGMMTGYPVGADSQYGWLDPLNILFAVASVEFGFKLLGFVQLLLGGLFSYLFLRESGLGKWSSVAGGFAFFTGPFLITKLPWPTFVAPVIWLPFLLWRFERAWKDKGGFTGMSRHAVIMAAGVATAFFGGFIPGFIMVVSSWFLYCVLRILFDSLDDLPDNLKTKGTVVIAAIGLGALLCAPQLLPTWELSGFSDRKTIPYEVHRQVSLPAEFVLTLANPYILGVPTSASWTDMADKIRLGANEWVGSTSFLEDDHYVGWAVMLLALWAVIACWRDGRIKSMAIIAVLSLLVLYGTPALALAYKLLPGFKSSRPDRIILVWGAFMAFLAGFGFDSILRGVNKKRALNFFISISGVIFIIALITFFLLKGWPEWLRAPTGELHGRKAAWAFMAMVAQNYKGWLGPAMFFLMLAFASNLVIYISSKRKRLIYLILPLMLIDTGVVAGGFLTFQDEWRPEKPLKSIRFLEGTGGKGRIARFDRDGTILPSNWPVIRGIDDAQGRAALLPRRYGRYFDLIEKGSYWRTKRLKPFTKTKSLASPLLDAAGVRYIVSDEALPVTDSGRDGGYRLVHRSEMFIYENMGVLPEAWVAAGAKFASNESEAETLLSMRDFEPELEVVLEGQNPGMKAGVGGSAQIHRRSFRDMNVKVSDTAEGWLVLADSWYPYWEASVKGERRKIWKANLAFMAVKVRPGETVRFRFVDKALMWGIAIAGVGLLIAIGLLLMGKSHAAATRST